MSYTDFRFLLLFFAFCKEGSSTFRADCPGVDADHYLDALPRLGQKCTEPLPTTATSPIPSSLPDDQRLVHVRRVPGSTSALRLRLAAP